MSKTRTWNGFDDVDANLRDDWLERLNTLQCLDLTSICEGHLVEDFDSQGKRHPYMILHLKDEFTDRGNRVNSCCEQLRQLIKQLGRLPDTAVSDEDSGFGADGNRAFGKIFIDAVQFRTTDDREPWADDWFERTITEVESVDQQIAVLLSVA